LKILSVGAELLHADGQTDRYEEANIRFSQFCEKRLKINLEEIRWESIDWIRLVPNREL
jgi:hypothetical protein